MSHLKYRPGPEPTELNDEDRLKFPGGGASGRARPDGGTPRHPAEVALERAQRRLDNLREALGPAFGRDQDGPRAA